MRKIGSMMSVSSLYVRVYIKVWYTAHIAACAPFQQLAGYKSISPALSKVASSKVAGHL